MKEITLSSPLNSYISDDGTLHLVQDTSFNQPLRIYDKDIGSHIDLTDLIISGKLKTNADDLVGQEFTITKPTKTQALISLSYTETANVPDGLYYYEIDSLNPKTNIKENLLRGRAIVYKNIN